MQWLHRIHAALSTGVTLAIGLGRMAIGLLVAAACLWLINASFTGRVATWLTVCVVIFAVGWVIRLIGQLLGPPEPDVTRGTRIERRKKLRRSGLL